MQETCLLFDASYDISMYKQVPKPIHSDDNNS